MTKQTRLNKQTKLSKPHTMDVASLLLDWQLKRGLELSYKQVLARKLLGAIKTNACRTYYKGEQVHCIDITLLPTERV